MLRTKITLLIVAGLTALGLVFAPTAAFAAVSDQLGEGVNAAAGSGSGCTIDGDAHPPRDCVNKTIAAIVNILSSIVAVVAVIMIIIAGFRYVSSGGDSNRTANAQKTIIYAVVGLVVAATAQLIVRFVLHLV
jgi:hypothetical protein